MKRLYFERPGGVLGMIGATVSFCSQSAFGAAIGFGLLMAGGSMFITSEYLRK